MISYLVKSATFWFSNKSIGTFYRVIYSVYFTPGVTPPVLSACPLHTNSGCGKERRILIGPW